MKKFISILAVSAIVLTAGAQKSVQGAGFFDNWSIGIEGGGITKTTHNAFWKNMRATYGVELTKQITPVFGLGVQFLANNNTSESKTVFDNSNLSLLGKFNLSNLFCGYNGEPRLFEVEAVAGAGWGHSFNHGEYTGCEDANYFTSQYGLNFNFNLGEDKAWTVSFKPSIVYNMDGGKSYPTYNVNSSAIQLLAGVTYHFKNSNNGKHYMTFIKAYDQAEVDGLNAKINDLRAQNADKDTKLASKDDEIRSLQQQLNDCRNQKPAVQTVTKATNSMEQTVTFRQGKSTVDASQLPNVERIATFLKNHKDATVSIKGYASPEGSAEVNEKIAKARAEAVKTILVNKYKIAANRISAEGQGVGNMFSEADWNRVSICTIDEAK
jgi:OmpA-OmpF porin, OOP family